MKVFINGRFLTQNITGVQRYAIEIVKAIDKLLEGAEYSEFSITLLTPKKMKSQLIFKNINIVCVGNFSGHFWEQIELPIYVGKDFLLNFCNCAPLLKRMQIVTIHDAAVWGYPQSFSIAFLLWYRFLLKQLGKSARKIVTVSNFSKNELIHYSNMPKDKIHVIYEGREQITGISSDAGILKKYNLQKKGFLLAVSSLNPNKNFQSIIDAVFLLKDLDLEIVIAGGTNPSVFENSEIKFPENVKYVGYISDVELKSLYENARCFIYPSFYEGFGLPPLEAMACGCPVIVSNTSSLPEVCGDAALYCDPSDPTNLAKLIRYLSTNKEIGNELSNKGFERSKLFSWDSCARGVLDLIYEDSTENTKSN